MNSLYFLPFISVFLLYSANKHGMHSDLSQWKLLLALVFIIIPAVYWVYDKIWGNRR